MVKSKCEALRDFVWREEKFKEGLQLVKVYFGVENLFAEKRKHLEENPSDVSFKERTFTLVHQPAMESR